jgi:aminoglycoside 3-N-acetyltransferase
VLNLRINFWSSSRMDQQAIPITRSDLDRGIERLGLSGQVACLHSSLKSFGYVDGGADAIVDAFLDAGCTLLVPTFTGTRFEVRPPADQVIERNGWSSTEVSALPERTDVVFTPDLDLIDTREMGQIATSVLRRPGRVRGNHPHNSFTALGPRASMLVRDQAWDDVYAPLREITKQRGSIVMAGVGLNRMTLLHFSETLSGRRLFRRWATGADGTAIPVPIGSCSEGFPNLESAIGTLSTQAMVGHSAWRVFPATETVTTSAAIIRNEPGITHCGSEECLRCPDAIAGGPII